MSLLIFYKDMVMIALKASISIQNFLDETIMIRRIATKEFAFDKGRYTVLNWYIDYVHSQQDNVSTVGADVINYNMILVDPEQGNKTHSYLQLEGLINLNESQLTVKKTIKKIPTRRVYKIIDWMCRSAFETYT